MNDRTFSMTTRDYDSSSDDEADGPTRRVGMNVSHEPISLAPAPALLHSLSSPLTSTVSPKNVAAAPGAAKSQDASSSHIMEIPTSVQDSVDKVPQFGHTLEQTAVFVPGGDPNKIAKRILTVLQQRSVEAEWARDAVRLQCTTKQGVEFDVNMYKPRQAQENGIIVEVQRQAGTSTQFYRDSVNPILKAATGEAADSPVSNGDKEDCLPEALDGDENYAPNGSESLEMVAKLMNRDDNNDSIELAYKMLLCLTSAEKLDAGTARAVANEVLQAGNVVGATLFADITSNTRRNMALQSLLNALEHSNDKSIDYASIADRLGPVLVKVLENAKSSPHAAQLALLCLEQLLVNGGSISLLKTVVPALEQAAKVGRERHASLEYHAQRCLAKLQDAC